MEIHNYQSENEELEKCPFCGEKPVWYLKGNADMIGTKRTVVVHCPTCGTTQETSVLKLPTKFACMQAVAKWNMRTKMKEEL